MESKIVTITIKIDDSCSMAHVSDGLKEGLEGNFHDFHNGCHGDFHLPEFNTVEEYVRVLEEKHRNEGKIVGIERLEYSYE